MIDKKPIFKPPYNILDVSVLFGIVAIFLVITAILGNDLFGIFQENVNFGWLFNHRKTRYYLDYQFIAVSLNYENYLINRS